MAACANQRGKIAVSATGTAGSVGTVGRSGEG